MASRSSESLMIAGQVVAPGQTLDLEIEVSERSSGIPVTLPVRVWRGAEPGPVVFVSAAIHGDELNGTGIVRSLAMDPGFELRSGTLLLVPVVNVLGFERRVRYMPDRRDLNRSFPGSAKGSLTARYAHKFFESIVRLSNYGIDLHTGAARRTNYANVRADASHPEVERLALAFGTELVINSPGPSGSLRNSAIEAGCPTIILEAGETLKVERGVVDVGRRGVHNVLIELGMAEGERETPPHQFVVEKTRWIRSNDGGLLDFHVAPGEIVEADQPLATCTDLLGRTRSVVVAPSSGICMGMTTSPAVAPGDPICHLALHDEKNVRTFAKVRDSREEPSEEDGMEHAQERLRDDLATNLTVSEPTDDSD